MKVLQIDVNCKNSSTGKIVYDLYSALNSEKDTIAVCYGRGNLIDEPNIYKFGIDWETYIHAAFARATGFNGCFSHLSTKRLLRYIEEFNPDVIHMHELHAYFVNIKPLVEYIKRKQIPVVWTFHCEYMYTGKCGYAYDCDKWKKECGSCPSLKEYPKSLVFDHTKEMFRLKRDLLKDLNVSIVTPSQWLAERVKQSFLKDKPVQVVHNGIDTDSVFYPRDKEEINSLLSRYSLDNRKKVLAVAPNIMEDRKGGKIVLKIAENMPDLQFILVGADESKRYSKNVLLIQSTKDQHELARWYSLADLFLICSKMENFPTTCLEALSCGTPIVGIDTGGTKETAPAPYGIFVSGERVQTELLQQEISSQINIGFARDEIRNTAVKMYSRDVMCSAYYNLYKQCCKME